MSTHDKSVSDRPALFLATRNPGKIRELTAALGEYFTVVARPEDLAETVEDRDTLVGNSMKKAVEVADHTGSTALADDTGLFVEALGGRPGVRSARYAGPEADSEANRTKMLTELDGIADRRAYVETIIVVCFAGQALSWPTLPDPIRRGVPVIAWGRVNGAITAEPRGSDGFGYDSIFQPDEGGGATFAQMSLADKQAISHRGRALVDLNRILGIG